MKGKTNSSFTMCIILASVLTTAGFAETLDFDVTQFQPAPEIYLEKDSYGYFGVGIGPLILPLPNATLGFRTQKEHFGFDFGTSVATAGVLTHLKGFANVLWYPAPSKQDQFYMGLGACGGPWISSNEAAFVGGGNIVIGNEFSRKNNKSFFQANIVYPTFFMVGVIYTIPLVTLSYGWGF